MFFLSRLYNYHIVIYCRLNIPINDATRAIAVKILGTSFRGKLPCCHCDRILVVLVVDIAVFNVIAASEAVKSKNVVAPIVVVAVLVAIYYIILISYW